MPVPARRPLPPPYGTAVFDCDSTLARIEGIEALTALDPPATGREEQIRALTERAMRGAVPLEDVYGRRLALLRPSAAQVRRLGAAYVAALLPNVRELVAALTALGKRVCIVSGGLAGPVRELARAIGVRESEVYAVEVEHDAEGRYVDFDRASPLARAGGKLAVLRGIGAGPSAAPPLVLVGDGATDLEAAPACARFVGFGGVVARPEVLAAADVDCREPDFAALLPYLCDARELARLEAAPEHSDLVRRARALTPSSPD